MTPGSRSANRILYRAVAALFLMGFYYNWYRYPFMINSSSTTQNYSDTPFLLQFAKYVLVMMVLFYVVIGCMTSKRELVFGKAWRVMGYAYLAAMPLAYGVMTADVTLIEIGLFFLIPIALHLFRNASISASGFRKLISSAILIAIAVDVLQVALFLVFGRLPALAWEDSFLIRFGSFLDDPNGFGVLLAMLIGFAMVYYQSLSRLLILGLLFVCLVITQSMTAIAAVTVALFAYGTLVLLHRPIRVVATVCAVIACLGLIAFLSRSHFATLASLYEQYMAVKSLSIAGHMQSFDILQGGTLYHWLGLHPVGFIGESGYINLLLNFGVFYVMVYLAMGAAAAYRYYRIWSRPGVTREAAAFTTGAFMFTVAVYVATANLPLEQVFPINLLLTLILGLSSSGVLAESQQGFGPSTAHQPAWSPD